MPPPLQLPGSSSPTETGEKDRPWTAEEDAVFESVSRKGAHKVCWALVQYTMRDSGFPRTIRQLKNRRQYLDLGVSLPVPAPARTTAPNATSAPAQWTPEEDSVLLTYVARYDNDVRWAAVRERMRKRGYSRTVAELVDRVTALKAQSPTSKETGSPLEGHSSEPPEGMDIDNADKEDTDYDPLVYLPAPLVKLDKHGRPPLVKFVEEEDNIIVRCLLRRKFTEERWDHIAMHLSEHGFSRTAYACQHRAQKLCDLSQAKWETAKLAGDPLPQRLEMPNGPLRKRPRSFSGIQQHRWTPHEEVLLKKCLSYKEAHSFPWQSVAEWMTDAGYPRTSSAVQQRAKRIREDAERDGMLWADLMALFHCDRLPVEKRDSRAQRDSETEGKQQCRSEMNVNGQRSPEVDRREHGPAEIEDDVESMAGVEGGKTGSPKMEGEKDCASRIEADKMCLAESENDAARDTESDADQDSSATQPSVEVYDPVADHSPGSTPEKDTCHEEAVENASRVDSSGVRVAKVASPCADDTMKEPCKGQKYVKSVASRVDNGSISVAGHIQKRAAISSLDAELQNPRSEKALSTQAECEPPPNVQHVHRTSSAASKPVASVSSKAETSCRTGCPDDTPEKAKRQGLGYVQNTGGCRHEKNECMEDERKDGGKGTRALNHAERVLNYLENEPATENMKGSHHGAVLRRSKRCVTKEIRQTAVVEDPKKAVMASVRVDAHNLDGKSDKKAHRKEIIAQVGNEAEEEPELKVRHINPFYESLSESDDESSLGDVPIRGALGEIPAWN